MKRSILALGMALALFVFAFVAWSALSGRDAEPGVTADARPTPAPTDEPDLSALPTLPSLGGANGLGGGFGGGGGGGEGTADGIAVESSMRWMNPLSGTTYILNTTLPLEPTGAVVYDTAGAARYSYQEALDLAARFGFSGPAYVEQYYMEPGNEWTPSIVYQFYNGAFQLAVGDSYFSYMNNGLYANKGFRPLASAQAGPIAEAFLREHGLLDFPYEMVSFNGFDIEFRRVVEGRVITFPEIQVSVSEDGQVAAVFGNPLRGLNALGNYPLRSAEEAWQLLQEQGADFRQVFFSTMPGPDFVMPEVPLFEQNPYRNWNRQYSDGQRVNLYSYPMVFIPQQADGTPAAAGSAELMPRIVVDWYTLSGSAEQLWGLTEYVGQQVQLTGIYRETAAGPTLEIESWTSQENPVEYTFREGAVSRSARQTLIVVSESESYIIPDAPADLADGEKIYIGGWIEAPVGSTTPSVLNWQSMGIVVEETVVTEEPVVEIMPVMEYRIGEVTVEQVDLVYAVISVYDETTQTASFTLSPVWRFKGSTDTLELIDIYVQAVPDTLVEQPEG